MSAEGESLSNHAVVPTDSPGTASAVDMDTNEHILNSLNSIDQTMGQVAGLIARICEDRSPSGRKRSKRSVDPSSESEHEHHSRRSNSKRARENTPSDDD